MEGEEGLGMTRIRMSTLNLRSGNRCEWMESISPPSLACPSPVSLCSCIWPPQWPLLLHLLTLPVPYHSNVLSYAHSAVCTANRARAQREALGANSSVACCEHGSLFPRFLSGESLFCSSGPALSPDRAIFGHASLKEIWRPVPLSKPQALW